MFSDESRIGSFGKKYFYSRSEKRSKEMEERCCYGVASCKTAWAIWNGSKERWVQYSTSKFFTGMLSPLGIIAAWIQQLSSFSRTMSGCTLQAMSKSSLHGPTLLFSGGQQILQISTSSSTFG